MDTGNTANSQSRFSSYENYLAVHANLIQSQLAIFMIFLHYLLARIKKETKG